MCLYPLFFRRQTADNRAILAKCPPDDRYLYQEEPLFAQLRYGIKPMSYNGCEVIACYHAERYFGKAASLADTADLCARAGLWLLGLFGTYPHSLYTFCRKAGYHYRRYTVRRSDTACRSDRAITEDGILYSYWNPRFRGIHTVALLRDQTTGRYFVTNHRALKSKTFPTAADALSAIRTACPILCLGIRPIPHKTNENRRNQR